MLKSLNNDREVLNRLNEKTAYLEKGMREVLTKNNIDFTINRVGSMISIFFDKREIYDFKTAGFGDTQRFKDFFHGLLKEGIYIAPSSYETWFITDALSYDDLDFTIAKVDKVSSEF